LQLLDHLHAKVFEDVGAALDGVNGRQVAEYGSQPRGYENQGTDSCKPLKLRCVYPKHVVIDPMNACAESGGRLRKRLEKRDEQPNAEPLGNGGEEGQHDRSENEGVVLADAVANEAILFVHGFAQGKEEGGGLYDP
jgi:hypothetical protein